MRRQVTRVVTDYRCPQLTRSSRRFRLTSPTVMLGMFHILQVTHFGVTRGHYILGQEVCGLDTVWKLDSEVESSAPQDIC
jgi:hypothetical protein